MGRGGVQVAWRRVIVYVPCCGGVHMVQRKRGSALLWGLIFGLIILAVELFDRFFLSRTGRKAAVAARALGAIPLHTFVVFIVVLALLFFAGFLAARRSGRLESGIGAGLIASGLVTVVMLALGIVLVSTALAGHRRAGGVPAGTTALVIGVVLQDIRGLIAMVAAGIGMGALGGLAGRRRQDSGGMPYQPRPNAPMTGFSSQPTAYIPGANTAPSVPPAPSYPPSYSRGDDTPTVQSSIIPDYE
jgi:hypothetical protein